MLDTLCMFVARGLQMAVIFVSLVLLCCARADAQREAGELHLEVQDQQGAPIPATGELISEANQLRRNFSLGSDGRTTAQDLPFASFTYRKAGKECRNSRCVLPHALYCRLL